MRPLPTAAAQASSGAHGGTGAVQAAARGPRFEPLVEQLRADAAAGGIPGAVAWVRHGGRTALLQACGVADLHTGEAMRTDTIFWIASMTKPVTCVAALLLAERGLLRLEDPVSAYLPQLAGLQVAGGGRTRVEPRVLDLMRHTAGFTYGAFDHTPVHAAYERLGVYDFGQTNAEMVDKLAGIALLHEPGTVFEYGMSIDVLGRLLEVCSGESLDDFLRRHVFEPLGMADTVFRLDTGRARRAARPLPREAFHMAPPRDGPLRWLSGGGGLWSTAADYGRFAAMLLQGGRVGSGRLLQARSVELMCSNLLPESVRFGSYTPSLGAVAPTPAMGQGFGLGVSVRLGDRGNPLPGSAGDFGWPGVSGSLFWCDPRRDLAVVVMMQAPSLRLHYRALCRQLVYRALDEWEGR